ncbi:MAG: AAA family ATPase, partial [Butyrivibrio sp.]|nr:AAA family ATPase [Butyrivibrio sp.]
MGKFGKKNVISEDISKYSICLLGEGGIGKTTLLYTVTDKLFGEGSTLFLELGKEQGADAIDGILYEDVPTWKKFEEITN